jgi:hypothetical protein
MQRHEDRPGYSQSACGHGMGQLLTMAAIGSLLSVRVRYRTETQEWKWGLLDDDRPDHSRVNGTGEVVRARFVELKRKCLVRINGTGSETRTSESRSSP